MDRRLFLTGLASGLIALPSEGRTARRWPSQADGMLRQHMIRPEGEADRSVELFVATPDGKASNGAMLFVHGHQGGRGIGARASADDGSLQRICSELNVTAAAVSQPGYGLSKGPPDFCGPRTQSAIRAALTFLRAQPNVDPGRIILYGLSRGAIASAMVATQDTNLRAVILAAGVYDLAAAYRTMSPGIRWNIEREAGTGSSDFAARSALYHADRIRSETLLLHGKRDDRAPIEQAEAMAKALADAGTEVSLKAFDSGHNIPHALTRTAIVPLLRKVFAPNGRAN